MWVFLLPPATRPQPYVQCSYKSLHFDYCHLSQWKGDFLVIFFMLKSVRNLRFSSEEELSAAELCCVIDASLDDCDSLILQVKEQVCTKYPNLKQSFPLQCCCASRTVVGCSALTSRQIEACEADLVEEASPRFHYSFYATEEGDRTATAAKCVFGW